MWIFWVCWRFFSWMIYKVHVPFVNQACITVFDDVQSPPLCLVPPVSLGKSWSLTISLNKNYIQNFRIRNYFKKDFLNFSFHNVRYCNHLVTFLEKISHQFAFFKLSMKLARAISFSSSFFIWLFKINRIYIIIRICFLSVSSILIGSFSSSSFSSKLLFLYFIKILATGWPVAKIFLWNIQTIVCFYCINTTRSDNSDAISII